MELSSEYSGKSQSNALTSLACSCLASLVVARGETSKFALCLTSLLMSPPQLVNQQVKVPQIMGSLQRSVQAVLLGKTILPEWFSSGVHVDSKCLSMSFSRKLPGTQQFSH